MKKILMLSFSSLIFFICIHANTPNLDREAAAIDKKNTDEVKTKESAVERKNPYDQYIHSQMYHQEDRQDRGAQKVIERQEEREGEKPSEKSEGPPWQAKKVEGQD